MSALQMGAELHLCALLPRCIRPTYLLPRDPPSPRTPIVPDSPSDTLSPLVCGTSAGGWMVRGGSCGSAICAYTSAGSIEPGIDASRFNRRAGVISQRITVRVTKELSTAGCYQPAPPDRRTTPTHPHPPHLPILPLLIEIPACVLKGVLVDVA